MDVIQITQQPASRPGGAERAQASHGDMRPSRQPGSARTKDTEDHKADGLSAVDMGTVASAKNEAPQVSSEETVASVPQSFGKVMADAQSADGAQGIADAKAISNTTASVTAKPSKETPESGITAPVQGPARPSGDLSPQSVNFHGNHALPKGSKAENADHPPANGQGVSQKPKTKTQAHDADTVAHPQNPVDPQPRPSAPAQAGEVPSDDVPSQSMTEKAPSQSVMEADTPNRPFGDTANPVKKMTESQSVQVTRSAAGEQSGQNTIVTDDHSKTVLSSDEPSATAKTLAMKTPAAELPTAPSQANTAINQGAHGESKAVKRDPATTPTLSPTPSGHGVQTPQTAPVPGANPAEGAVRSNVRSGQPVQGGQGSSIGLTAPQTNSAESASPDHNALSLGTEKDALGKKEPTGRRSAKGALSDAMPSSQRQTVSTSSEGGNQTAAAQTTQTGGADRAKSSAAEIMAAGKLDTPTPSAPVPPVTPAPLLSASQPITGGGTWTDPVTGQQRTIETSLQTQMPGADPPQVRAGRIAQDIPVQMIRQVRDGINQFDVRLDPPELGRIDIRMEIGSDGRIQATLTADRPDALDLMRSEARLLERALNDAGLRADPGSLSFAMREDGSGGARQQHDRGSPEEAGVSDSGPEDENRLASETDTSDGDIMEQTIFGLRINLPKGVNVTV